MAVMRTNRIVIFGWRQEFRKNGFWPLQHNLDKIIFRTLVIENPDIYFRRSADPPAHLHRRFISLAVKGGDIGWLSQRQQVDRKQQGYCSVGYARVVEQSEKFDSIEYKNRRSAQLICDPKYIPIFSIISLHRDPKNIQICFLHINLHHAIVE